MKKISYNLFGCVLILILISVFAGCSQKASEAEEQSAVKTAGTNQATSGKNQDSMSQEFTGTVVDMIRAGRYAYIQVETGKKSVWVAVPAFNGMPGDKVTVPSGVPIDNFHSKTLNRNFEKIYFVGSIRKEGESPSAMNSQKMPEGHPPMGAKAQNQMIHPSMEELAQGPAIEIGEIKKAEGGQTVSEIITNSKSLAGKEIRVRAKVVKFTPNIMKRNWVHLRDGSGSKGSNDLIVTTNDIVKVGDVVMVDGIVSVDKDFGYGLKYRVIVENAKVTVE